jgi:hypothetical protein
MELYGHWNTGSVHLSKFFVISVLFVNFIDNYHLHFCDEINSSDQATWLNKGQSVTKTREKL